MAVETDQVLIPNLVVGLVSEPEGTGSTQSGSDPYESSVSAVHEGRQAEGLGR